MTNKLTPGIAGWHTELVAAGLDETANALIMADHTKRQTVEYTRFLRSLGLPTLRSTIANAGEFFDDMDGWFDALDTETGQTDKYFVAVEEPERHWRDRALDQTRREAMRFVFGTLAKRGDNVFQTHDVFIRQYMPTKYRGEFWLGPHGDIAGIMESVDGTAGSNIRRGAFDFDFSYSSTDARLRGLIFWAVSAVIHSGKNFQPGSYQYVFNERPSSGSEQLAFLDYFP